MSFKRRFIPLGLASLAASTQLMAVALPTDPLAFQQDTYIEEPDRNNFTAHNSASNKLHSNSFKDLYVFGDSLSDNGNRDDAPWTNGYTAVELIGQQMGLELTASDKGGNNYAVGGNTTEEVLHSITGSDERCDPGMYMDQGGNCHDSLSKRLNDSGESLNSDALYFVFAGGNDYLQNLTTGGAETDDVGKNIVLSAEALTDMGAEYIVAINVPDISKTPGINMPVQGLIKLVENDYSQIGDAISKFGAEANPEVGDILKQLAPELSPEEAEKNAKRLAFAVKLGVRTKVYNEQRTQGASISEANKIANEASDKAYEKVYDPIKNLAEKDAPNLERLGDIVATENPNLEGLGKIISNSSDSSNINKLISIVLNDLTQNQRPVIADTLHKLIGKANKGLALAKDSGKDITEQQQKIDQLEKLLNIAESRPMKWASDVNSSINTQVAASNSNIILLDINGLFKEVMADPRSFGIDLDSENASNTTDKENQTIDTIKNILNKELATTYADTGSNSIFWDLIHPAEKMQAISADYMLSVFNAPAEISQLPEMAIRQGQSLTKETRDQLNWFSRNTNIQTGEGQVYISGNPQQGRIKTGLDNTIDTEDTYFGIGFNHRFNDNWLLGGMFSRGDSQMDIEKSEYKMLSTNLNLVLQYQQDNWYTNLSGGYSYLDYDSLKRRFYLGDTMLRTEKGDTTGSTFSLGAELGYRIALTDQLSVTPKASLDYYQTKLDGYSENKIAVDSSSLIYKDMERKALFANIGSELDYVIDNHRFNAEISYLKDLKEGMETLDMALGTISPNQFYLPTGYNGGDKQEALKLEASYNYAFDNGIQLGANYQIYRDFDFGTSRVAELKIGYVF